VNPLKVCTIEKLPVSRPALKTWQKNHVDFFLIRVKRAVEAGDHV
jgi:hypothetical protein